jgi:hypothetical protein
MCLLHLAVWVRLAQRMIPRPSNSPGRYPALRPAWKVSLRSRRRSASFPSSSAICQRSCSCETDEPDPLDPLAVLIGAQRSASARARSSLSRSSACRISPSSFFSRAWNVRSEIRASAFGAAPDTSSAEPGPGEEVLSAPPGARSAPSAASILFSFTPSWLSFCRLSASLRASSASDCRSPEATAGKAARIISRTVKRALFTLLLSAFGSI